MDIKTESQTISDSNAAEELIQLFAQLKQYMREELEEKETLSQKLSYNESNVEWNKEYLNELRQQLEEYKSCVASENNVLHRFSGIKEMNNELNAKTLELNKKLKTTERMNEELVETIKTDMNSKINELKVSLNSKENDIKDLKLEMSSKDIEINRMKRELTDNKTKSEEHFKEIKEFYENQIKNLNKEFDRKYQKCLQTNDEKVIEIKANCLRTIDKTKDEFENKLIKSQNDLKELNEKYRYLSLELEARKMSTNFVNPNKSGAKSKSVNNADTKSRASILVLDSGDGPNAPTVQLVASASKRKKLIQNSDSYLDFLREEL